MAALLPRLSALLLGRTSTFTLALVAGAVVFERGFDHGSELLWDKLNYGKLWKHNKHKYETEE
ncbi:cytochrome b-c1 complex subunit 9 [Petromyzon marinus]|uniref:Complex III subunit 9 n=1 Tax=Petromyzon marinus TaxID=7757 RepID=A0AAJ7UKJ1_PETMA|nr:cytochrome b-c1 complex subunit 9 [Petromyzon marinus]